MITLEIPRVPPSPNDLLGYHWRYRTQNSKVWRDEVYYALRAAGSKPRKPFLKARVEIDRRSRGVLDPDNLYGAMKPVIDGLRHAGVIEDDTPEHIELIVTQHREFKLPPRTLICVKPV